VDEYWERRRFLKRLCILGAGAVGISAAGVLVRDRGRDEPLPGQLKRWQRDFRSGVTADRSVVAVGKGAPTTATRAAVNALGGMGAFVKKGETVAIKPNIGWDRIPTQAANTHPEVVAALVSLCLEAGASKVIVTDNSCNEAKRCFTRSGIWKAAEQAGATIILPDEHRFSQQNLGGVLGTIPVLMPAVDADRLINAAVAKHHGLAKFTGAMKNLYGVIGGRRNRHHQQIDQSIVDLTSVFYPTLSIVDATRVLLRNGPQGGDLNDTREIGQVIASMDPIAADAYACTLIDVSPEDLPYLSMAQGFGLGSFDPNVIKKVEVS
jgi:uncharacterized protein (DUF362 family)